MEPAKDNQQRLDEQLETDAFNQTNRPTAIGDATNLREPVHEASATTNNRTGNKGHFLSDLDAPEVSDALALLASVRELKKDENSKTGLPEYIGRYRILNSAGRGGFSEVFHAVDEDLQRHVALKIPLIAGREDSQLRFEREARLAAMLSHRQIVPVYEFGCVGSIDFIAYGWVEGETLADWLASKGGKTETKLAAMIIAQIARAMHFAHERGVVHRDLKPANILIDQSETYRDQPLHLRTRITDLGLSRDLADDNQRLTQTGQAIGTPGYMSPEQAGGITDTNIGTDIYSIGVILFELLTGRLPFQEPNAFETIKAIHERPAPSVSLFRSGISSELAAIVDKCLQKKPQQRYLTAFDLAEDLDAFVDGRPVKAKPVGKAVRIGRWIARNRTITATTALLLSSLSIGLGATLWQWNNSRMEAERAESHLANMTSAVELLLEEIITKNEPTQVTDAQRNLLEEVLRLQQSFIGAPDYDKVSKTHIVTLQRTSQICRAIGELDGAVDAFNEMRTIDVLDIEPVDKDLADIVFKSYLDGIAALNGKGQRVDAAKAIKELQEFHDSVKHLFTDDENSAQSITTGYLRGVVLQRSQKWHEALKAHQETQIHAAHLEESGAAHFYRERIASNLTNQAICEKFTGDHLSSIKSATDAIALYIAEREANPDENNLKRNLSLAYELRSEAFAKLNQKQNARDDAQRSVDIMLELTNAAPNNNRYVVGLAGAYNALAICTADGNEARVQQAIEILNQVLELEKRGLSRTLQGQLKMVWAQTSQSYHLSHLKRYEESFAAAESAKKLVDRFFENDPGNHRIAERSRAWSNYLNAADRFNQSRKFVDAFPEFKILYRALLVQYEGTPLLKRAERVLAWSFRRAARHYAKVGKFDKAMEAIEDLSKTETHLQHPRVDLARTTSEVVGMWKESDNYSSSAVKEAMDRIFAWLREAIVENKWSAREIFEKESMQSVVEDERFAEIIALMDDTNRD